MTSGTPWSRGHAHAAWPARPSSWSGPRLRKLATGVAVVALATVLAACGSGGGSGGGAAQSKLATAASLREPHPS